MDNDTKNEFINKMIKLSIDKKTAESIESAINKFCYDYTKNNDTPYLLQSTYDTKITEVLSYLEIKNSYLLNAIKKKNIKLILYIDKSKSFLL